jgi:hypothetical protein
LSELEPLRRASVERITAGDIPGLARVVATGSFRLGMWGAATTFKASRRVVDVAMHPDHAVELAEDLRIAGAAITRALVGDEVERVRAVAAATPVVRVVAEAVPGAHTSNGHVAREEDVNPLHQAGQELLRKSRDVWNEDRGHPAYARIIEELAPDEGRILMLLLKDGPQATVDIRTGGMVGSVSSTLVAPGLNMIGAHAGCRFVERVPSYLHNLERLGLVWFSRETVRDPMDYQVLEAQPDVIAAMHSVRKHKVVRRSIHLTPFGEDFCRDGLGLSPDMLEAVPKHGNPDDE